MAVLGSPDSDVVLSGQELLSAIADLLDAPPDGGEESYAAVEVKVVSENFDLRVGERASKRRRSAGTATLAVLEQSAQLHAKSNSQPGRSVGVEAAGELPPGWSVSTKVIGDGRRYKRYEAPDGKVFQSYEKAMAYWDTQAGQAPTGRRRRRKAVAQAGGDAAVLQLVHPDTMASLAEWLRDNAARGGTADTSDKGFVDAALLARAACLDVRITRTK